LPVDPEYGEPAEPKPKKESRGPRGPRPEKVPGGEEDGKKVKTKLADGKPRTIKHMVSTTFWHPDGTPMFRQSAPPI
jgi:type I restriction enzyme R subunit